MTQYPTCYCISVIYLSRYYFQWPSQARIGLGCRI